MKEYTELKIKNKKADDYWKLKKKQGAPDDFEIPMRMAFMAGYDEGKALD